ncbi:MAG: hypothetical protein IJS14_10935 [Lentisphaeria bacterium]|nr:hypothetical protein [Lentisphaeria bacterium]
MLTFMIGLIIVVGIINTLICLGTGDVVSTVLSGISIYPLCWCYSFLFKAVALPSNNYVLQLLTFAVIAVAYSGISFAYAAFTMKAGQIKPFMLIVLFQIIGLMFATF